MSRASRPGRRIGATLLLVVFSGIEAVGQTPILPSSASCSTATCHGAVPGRGEPWRSSASTFQTHDPHTDAYRVLWNDQSRRIVNALDPAAADSDAVYRNVLGARCVSCHATVDERIVDPGGFDDLHTLGGVSCESCHGPAEGWLAAHRDVDWPQLGLARYEQPYNMLPTESLDQRAAGCMRCHVGSRTADGLVRDMNHDLIAAGHPVLRFDFASYLQSLPAHWDVAEEHERVTEAGGWEQVYAIGRREALLAMLRLSRERSLEAAADRTSVPYPELSESDCFACHRSLESPDRYAMAESKAAIPELVGRPTWAPWYTAGLDLSAAPTMKLFQQGMSLRLQPPARAASAAGKTLQELQQVSAAQLLPQQARPAPGNRWQHATQWALRRWAASQDSASPRGTTAGHVPQPLLQFFEAHVQFDRTARTDSTSAVILLSPAEFDPDAASEDGVKLDGKLPAAASGANDDR